MIDNNYDIWSFIFKVLNKKEPIKVLSFISICAYGNTLKRTSEILQVRVEDIKEWNAYTVVQIKSLMIKNGVNPKNISTLMKEGVNE